MENKKPITFESRLQECAVQDERAGSLLRSYETIKEDMKMYLPAISSYYPHYSAHDSSHSQSLISAIELILGEHRIQALSLADIWLILVAAQLHDIGMIIPNEEVLELVNTPEFKKYLESMKGSTDVDFARAAMLLLDKKIRDDDNAWFLEIRQSVILLVAEYLRRRHAERSGNIVSGDTVISRLLSLKQNGDMSRAYATVGKICAMHGRSFDDIFTLYETDSILHLDCHPRFVAAFIRLGDLCDVDNGRFNAALMAVFGKLPQSSLVHFHKHKTITRLRISAREICMSANIPFERIQNELTCEGYDRAFKGEDFCHKIVYEHQRWFNMIKEEIQNLLLHAGEIFPEDIDQTLPAFKQEILVNGQHSVFANSNLRLNFAPEKAYALIEGYSLYDEQRTFVREFVQNSLDAIKIQLWRDLKDGRWNSYLSKEKRENLSALQPFDLCKDIYEAYFVEIETKSDETSNKKTITFQDNGIGISYDDLQNNIIQTGTSWSSRAKYEDELNQMPPWMRPTGGFGIGLHSAFAVTDKIEIRSKTRYEEDPKHIIIHSGQQDGFVFARTIKEAFFYGTKITLEIEKPMSEIRSEKSEITPYDPQPDDEFAFFIEEYLRKILCCPLFSVYLNEKIIGEILCTGSLYGAIFDRERRDEKDDNVALAVTDDVPMRYIVWNQKEGHFYRILPRNDHDYGVVCSFKGIRLFLNRKIEVYYSDLVHLEALECLSADSKKTISADRKDFLIEYKVSITDIIKSIFKPLLRFGEEQFEKLLKAPSGCLSTEDFLTLCDEIAQFAPDEDISLSDKRKEILDQFIMTIAEEQAKKKTSYFAYLAFTYLRYFTESTWQFLHENSALISGRDEQSLFNQLMVSLQPKFQIVKDTFEYLYKKSDSVFGSEFGRKFGRKFGSMFGSMFGSEFISEFSSEFIGEFGSEFSSEFGRVAYIDFGRKFSEIFGDIFGNHILTNQWTWLVWIGYYEKQLPKCATSVYFQSIPSFHFHYYIEDAKTVFDIINKSELSVLYKNIKKMYIELPFSKYLFVKEIEKNNNISLCILTVEAGTNKTIETSEKNSLAVYYSLLEKEQNILLCPASYKNLGITYIDIPDHLNERIFYNNLYIFLPRTIEEVDFLDFIIQHKDKTVATIVDAIMQAEDTVNIIKYTYLHRQDKTIIFDNIQAEYRSFLMEFVTARLEGNQNALSEIIEDI